MSLKNETKANVRSPLPVANKAVNTREEMAKLLEDVAANPAKVEFPRDTWGFTSELKKAALKAASSVNGQEDKQQLLLDTLSVIVKHVIARLPKDREFRAHLRAQGEKAAADEGRRQRAFGQVVTKKDKE